MAIYTEYATLNRATCLGTAPRFVGSLRPMGLLMQGLVCASTPCGVRWGLLKARGARVPQALPIGREADSFTQREALDLV